MEREVIQEALTQALLEIQINSGRTVPAITEDTHPIGDLDGFDSVNTVEVACLISESLEVQVAAEVILKTPFGRPLTVGEMVDQIATHLNQQEGVAHGKLKFSTKPNWR